MYVKKLELVNIRSFTKATVEFSKGINIIIGTNNSGKSTVLRSLQKLQQGLLGIGQEDVRKTATVGKIHVELQGIDQEDYSIFQIKEGGQINLGSKQNIIFSLWNDRRGKAEDQFQFAGDEFNISMKENDITAMHKSGEIYLDEKLIKFPGFSSMEDENNFIYPFLARRKVGNYNGQGGRQSAFGINDQLYNLPSRIQNLENGTHPYSAEYKTICNDILGFAPGKVPGEQNNGDKLGMFIRSKDTVYLESMGEGVANILGILAILLTDDNKLFLIEELENDIHPEALKKLLAIIIDKAKTNQFIITTHSNIVLKYLASLPDTKIFFTDLELIETGKGKKYKIPTSTITEVENNPADRLDILTKLGYDLFDFDLYSSYILFEESSAEQIVRDFLIPEFAPELKDKVRTISSAGVDKIPAMFDSFLSLFKYIHTSPVYKEKAWVIADGDPAGVEIIKKLTERFKDWPKTHFINFTKNNFEDFYPPAFKKAHDEINKKYNGSNHQAEKRQHKTELTKKVLQYIHSNRENAKLAFSESAIEVIDILKEISRTLQPKTTKKPKDKTKK